jgi:hypothetical protein
MEVAKGEWGWGTGSHYSTGIRFQLYKPVYETLLCTGRQEGDLMLNVGTTARSKSKSSPQ